MTTENTAGEIEESTSPTTGTNDSDESTPLLSSQNTDSKSQSSKVPEVEINLLRRGRGPIAVFKSRLGGYEQDQLEVREILEKYNFKAIYAFNSIRGRGAPIRFYPRNGLSMIPYTDGAVISVDGEPKIANTTHARPGAGGYWHVKNDESMPMIQSLMDMRNPALSNRKSGTKVAEDIVDEKLTFDESNPIPDVSIYHGDSHLKGKHSYVDESDPISDATIYHGDAHLKGKTSYVDESNPIPDVSIYHGDSHLKGKNSYVDESNPIPDVSIYHGDFVFKGENSYVDESNPIPDVSIYHGDSRMKGKECKSGDITIMGN